MRPPPKSRGKLHALCLIEFIADGFNEAPAEKQGKT